MANSDCHGEQDLIGLIFSWFVVRNSPSAHIVYENFIKHPLWHGNPYEHCADMLNITCGTFSFFLPISFTKTIQVTGWEEEIHLLKRTLRWKVARWWGFFIAQSTHLMPVANFAHTQESRLWWLADAFLWYQSPAPACVPLPACEVLHPHSDWLAQTLDVTKVKLHFNITKESSF